MKTHKKVLWIIIILLICFFTAILTRKSEERERDDNFLFLKMSIRNVISAKVTFIELDFLSDTLTYYLNLDVLYDGLNNLPSLEDIETSQEKSIVVIDSREIKKIKNLISSITYWDDNPLPGFDSSIITLWIDGKKCTFGYGENKDKALYNLVQILVKNLPE